MANTIKIRKGLFANLPSLENAEFGFSTDTAAKRLHIGWSGVNHEIAMKSYVDLLVQGIQGHFVADVRAQGNVPISGLSAIDGETLTDGELVLADQQTTVTEDGLWEVHTGAWTRATGWEVGTEAGGFFVMIKGGTDDGNGYICTNDDGSDVVGTNDLTMELFSSAGGGANKQLSNLEDVIAVNKSLLPGTQGSLDLGQSANTWKDLYLKSGGEIRFGTGSTDLAIVHSTGQLSIGSDNFRLSGNIGRDADNFLGWATDNSLAIRIGGSTHNIISISDGATDNDKLVTQGYVDDAVDAYNTYLELTDTESSYSGHGYDLVMVNAAENALVFMADIDGGDFV